jgi:hypothetical protein
MQQNDLFSYNMHNSMENNRLLDTKFSALK